MRNSTIFRISLALIITCQTIILPITNSVKAQELEDSIDIELITNVTKEPLLGDSGNIELELKNTSSERIYNVGFNLELPEGVTFSNSLPIVNNSDANIFNPTSSNSSSIKWENIADLLPNESVKVHFALNFEGLSAGRHEEPTYYVNDQIIFNASGNASYSPIFVGQVVEEKTFRATIRGVQVNTNTENYTKEVLVGEELKRKLEIKNNPDVETTEGEEVTITETLEDGLEYEWESEELINDISENTYDYEFRAEEREDGQTLLEWIIDSLEKENYENPVNIEYNIKVPYKKDIGAVVKENEEINIESEIEAFYKTRERDSELVNLTNSDTFRTKYINVWKSSDKDIVNPGDTINYKINIKTSEYYNYKNVVITDTLPDGIEFQNSDIPPTLTTENTNAMPAGRQGTITLVWELDKLSAGETHSIDYITTVSETYKDNSELLSNDPFKNKVEVDGEWNSTEDNRSGESDEKDSEYVRTPRVETNTTVWSEIKKEWVGVTTTNKGYPVKLKIETYVPEKVPTENLNLKLFYPQYLILDTSSANLFIQGSTTNQEVTLIDDGVDYINVDLGNATENTMITLTIDGVISEDENLTEGTTLRTLTRVVYTNHNGSQRQEVGQGTFLIKDPIGKITLTNTIDEIGTNSKYTINDLIRKTVSIEVPDASLQNKVRYKYIDKGSGESKETEWESWDINEGLQQTFPDYLLKGNIDGEKEICVKVKDVRDNESGWSCDLIILDTKAPRGSILINNGDRATADLNVSLTIESHEDNVDDPVLYSYSLGNSKWSEWAEFEDEVEFEELLPVEKGTASAFLRLKDEAGNIYETSDSIIIISDNSDGGSFVKKYGAEFINTDDYLSSIGTYSLEDFPESYYTGEKINLVFDVENTSNFTWYPNIGNAVNISFHWYNIDQNYFYRWNGNRYILNDFLSPEQIYEDVRLRVDTPDRPGNYILQLDVVEEGITWFSEKSVSTYDLPIVIADPFDNDLEEGLPDYPYEDDFGGGGYETVSCNVAGGTRLLISPEIDSDIIQVFESGEKVNAFNYRDQFAQVQFDGNKIGWISIDDLDCEKAIQENLPEFKPNNTYFEKAFVCNSRITYLKNAPDWNSKTIKYLTLEEEFYVLEEVPDSKGNSWLQILTLDGLSGWMMDSFVCLNRDGQTYNWVDYIQFERAYEDPNIDPDGNYYDVGITSDFGEREGKYHAGVDYGLYCGTELYSAAKGVVLTTFTEGIDLGNESTVETPANYVIIEHESEPDPETGEVYKFQTRYWHLDEVWVLPGQEVEQGEAIGTSGNTGYVRGHELDATATVHGQEPSVTGPGQGDVGCHLHFEAHRYNKDGSTYAIDPELLFQYGEINSPIILGLSNLGDSETIDEFGYGGPGIVWDKLVPVHRFWSSANNGHFYTINEKEYVLDNLSDTWEYEQIAFYVYEEQVPDTKPVYRFWSDSLQAHFYTISYSDKVLVENTWPDVWAYEDIGFYTYDSGGRGNINPVQRFWSNTYMNHFYTIDSNEANYIKNDLSDIWKYERIDFYAVPANKYAIHYARNQITEGASNRYKGEGTVYCGTYKNEIKWHVSKDLYSDRIYNPELKQSFDLQVDNDFRGTYYDQKLGGTEDIDQCKILGLPTMNKAKAATSPYSTSGEYQEFSNNGTIYYSSEQGTNMVFGRIWKKHQESGGTAGFYGFPKGWAYEEEEQGMLCQEFEGGWLCEYEWITCKENEYLENRVCKIDWENICSGYGMEKYVNPNDSFDITCAKINDAPYINQYLNESGELGDPIDGWMMCGANAAVMGLIQNGILPDNQFYGNKKYTYSIDGVVINDFRRCPSTPNMSNIRGAFSYTAIPHSGFNCNINGWEYIASYMTGAGHGVNVLKPQDALEEIEYYNFAGKSKNSYMSWVKTVIDQDGGIIQALGNDSLGHIILVKGYTYDGRIVVNDSYTNLMKSEDHWEYDFTGNGAIYDYENPNVGFSYSFSYN